MSKDYYIGLDIGTNSVGWAVTDPEYNLCRFKGKDMWGIRLFESAETAENRRLKRTNRRRLKRRHQRLMLLQDIFAEEISKVDPSFFVRLNESRLQEDDRSEQFKHPLFNDQDYTDIDFYNQYPTMYHLRSELIRSNAPHDPRLVYLAIHHIIKYRGHFLIEGDLEAAKSFEVTFARFIETAREMFGHDLDVTGTEEFKRILSDSSVSRSVKQKRMEALFSYDETSLEKDAKKAFNNRIKEITKLLAGNQGDITKIFEFEFVDEDITTKFNLSDGKYEEEIEEKLAALCPDESNVLGTIKALFDWSVLVEILGDEEYLSTAKVAAYEKHKNNLYRLRRVMKKYCDRQTYKEFFDGKASAGYSCYVRSLKKNGKKHYIELKQRCDEDSFYKNLGKILAAIDEKVNEADRAEYDYLVAETSIQKLLPLQRSKDNGAIPKQVHEAELKKILANASGYLDFLTEKDSDGYTGSEKIIAIFNHKIPYYVGPISDRHRDKGANNWAVRKKEGRIYPWNLDEMIDAEASNEQFINRMTNKCTYLIGEDVLPKNSLLYSRYMVLNELNNLKIRGHAVTVEKKQQIFHDLFETSNRVTGKKLLDYLKKEDCELTLEDLSGFDQDFKASLSSYLDFKNKVFGEKINEDKVRDMTEDIIRWATIYGNDSGMLERVIRKKYSGEISDDEIKAIKKLRYSGWGNFSRQFLSGIEGINKDTGEVSTIIGALWANENNDNLMQVLSSKYTFSQEIKSFNAEREEKISRISYDALVKDMYTSPANKRAIWQTILIVQEITKIMGNAPKKFFVEMAKGEDKEKKRTKSRKQKLLELYDACGKDVREWTSYVEVDEIERRDERDFNSMKLLLYYTQMGRCAYTGERIDLNELMSANSKWDRDHIYPQSKIKDDSIDNLVLVKKFVNAKKDNEMLSENIQKRMRGTWKVWLDKGFISKKKYDRLTRRDGFTDDELAGFVARQLVETRQSTKLVAELLERMYPDSSIIRVKAGLVSDFRKAPLNVLKCRLVNDYHHAKDAYLNVVVGNVYSTRFTSNPLEWVRKNRNENWSINKVFYFDVKGAWDAPAREKGPDNKWRSMKNEKGEFFGGTLDKVRAIVKRNNVLYTEYTYCEKGQLFDETLFNKRKGSNIPFKKGLDTSKYGGYSSPNTSYFAQVEFDGRKGERVKNIIGVPVYVANRLDNEPSAFVSYCEEIRGLRNVKVLIPVIKKNALIVKDEFPMRIRGESGADLIFKSNCQLILDEKSEETVRRIEKWSDKTADSISEKFDGLDANSLLHLYDVLCSKLATGGRFENRPANQVGKMSSGRDTFISLDLEHKVFVIKEVLKMLRCDAITTANLTMIGGTTTAGNIAVNKNTLGKKKVTIINTSVTGLFVEKNII